MKVSDQLDALVNFAVKDLVDPKEVCPIGFVYMIFLHMHKSDPCSKLNQNDVVLSQGTGKDRSSSVSGTIGDFPQVHITYAGTLHPRIPIKACEV